jgi:hypothetical protein
MRHAIVTILFALFGFWNGLGWAATQSWTWAQQADISAASSSASATAVATDAAGNTYVAGSFAGTARFGAYTLTGSGYTDIFIAKYDSGGTVLWAKQAGGMSCGAGGLATDGSEVFLTGSCVYGASFGGHALAASASYEQVFFLVAADAATGQFSRLLANGGTAAMSGNALALDGDGRLLVAGAFKGTASVLGTTLAATGSGYEDAFVFKINKAFDQLAWLRGGGGEYSDHAYAVATDAGGNVYIAGDIFSNVAQGTASFGTSSLAVTSSGDPFVAKLNSAGEWQWARSLPASAFDEARALAVDSAGNAYVAGRFAAHLQCGASNLTATALNSYAAFVAKFDASGNCLWAQQAGTTDNAALSDHNTAYGLALRAGNPVVTGGYRATTVFGTFSLTSRNMADVYVAELDAAGGDYLWVKSAGGGSGGDTGMAIALTAGGQFMVAGSFEDGASFDAASLSTGRYGEYWIADMFLAALDPAAAATTLDATMSASGTLTARTLTLGGMSVPGTDLAGGVSLYVAAYAGGNFFFLTGGGWTTQYLPYSSGVTSVPASITVADGMNLSGLVGTTVWFGYGRGTGDAALTDMLQGARYKQVYTIQ